MPLTSRQQSAVNCFCIVAQRFKIVTSGVQLMRENRIEFDKTPMEILHALMKQFGLKINKTSFLQKAGGRRRLPFFFEDARGLIVLALEENENGYLVTESADQVRRKFISKSELAEDCQGIVFEIAETRWTPTNNRTFGVWWLIEQTRPHSGVVGKIVLSALILQVFATAMPFFSQVIIDKVLSKGNPSMLYLLGSGITILIFFELVLATIRSQQQAHIASKLDISIGVQIQRHLFKLPLAYFAKRSTGHVTNIFNELSTIRYFITGPAVSSIVDVSFFVVFIPLMLAYSPTLSAIVAVSSILILIFAYCTKKLEHRLMRSVSEHSVRCNSQILEGVSNIETIKTLAAESQISRRWELSFTRLVAGTMKSAALQGHVQAINGFLQRLSTLAILWVGTELVLSNHISAGQLIAFQMLSFRVMYPLQRITMLWQEWEKVKHSVQRLSEIMDMIPEQQDGVHEFADVPAGPIRLESVNFKYPGQSRPALVNVNLEIEDNSTTAIVGRSGSGKSTLLKMFLKLYLPTGGRVEYGGTDVRQIDNTALRRSVSLVLQDSHLINASIRENIALGAPWATLEQIYDAAKCVGAHEFIMDLPHGYDTRFGEGGVNLSGGQRQRIALARAIVQNPDTLILDEATSAIDVYGERQIFENLTTRFKNRKLIVITHRLASIVEFDNICMMSMGQIVGIGTHDGLLKSCAEYATLNNVEPSTYQPENIREAA